jgi:predicted RNase H-like HicB family nuclease
MRRYSVILTPEEGGYVVTVPALAGCVTEGDTLEEALENAREAISLYVESLRARGLPVPEETAAPRVEAVEV